MGSGQVTLDCLFFTLAFSVCEVYALSFPTGLVDGVLAGLSVR